MPWPCRRVRTDSTRKAVLLSSPLSRRLSPPLKRTQPSWTQQQRAVAACRDDAFGDPETPAQADEPGTRQIRTHQNMLSLGFKVQPREAAREAAIHTVVAKVRLAPRSCPASDWVRRWLLQGLPATGTALGAPTPLGLGGRSTGSNGRAQGMVAESSFRTTERSHRQHRWGPAFPGQSRDTPKEEVSVRR